MPLWNELEGTRVAGKFPLNRLLRSEGRNAWFETANAAGLPATLSLSESLNDEDALLERLRAAEQLKHPNLIAITETGSAEAEDQPLVYALMEPVEESLADVLRERTLTTAETQEIADSLLPALEAIHGAGLVHGRVEPASVLAAGQTVKLRSDCLQKTDAESARRDDVRGFAATLYQSLTQKRAVAGVDASQLPAPFANIVRNGLGGQWTLADVRRALKGPAVETALPSTAPQRPASPAAGVVSSVAAGAVAGAAALPGRPAAAATPAAGVGGVHTLHAGNAPAGAKPGAAKPGAAKPGGAERESVLLDDEKPARTGRRRPGITLAALVVMAILILFFWWIFARRPAPTTLTGHSATPETSQSPDAASPVVDAPSRAAEPPSRADVQPPPPASNAQPGGTTARPSEAVSESMGAPGAMPAQPVQPAPHSTRGAAGVPSGSDTGSWHVIAFTYNHQDQAQHKVDAIAAQHPNLQPQVFSPTGHGHYLVTLGGGLSRSAAFALRNRARAEGMPSDVYVQNY